MRADSQTPGCGLIDVEEHCGPWTSEDGFTCACAGDIWNHARQSRCRGSIRTGSYPDDLYEVGCL